MSVKALAVAAAGAAGSVCFVAAVLVAWMAAAAGAGAGMSASGAGACGGAVSGEVPAELRPIFREASERYELGSRGPSILAGLTSVESGFGQNMGPSSAGAIGWTQFMPSTWTAYGVDANGDGKRDPFNAVDAIHSSANYLRASGAPGSWRKALFAYNHAQWYVDKVLKEAQRLSAPGVEPTCETGVVTQVRGVRRITGGGRIVAIPGMPGESVDERILPDLLTLIAAYRLKVTDGYAQTGHEADGEHPLGLGVDIVPGPKGTWDDVDRLARWAEPQQGRPRPPFRWVGYNGDSKHGRGHHLHLSWNHAPAPSRRPPAAWVEVFGNDG